MVKKSKSEKKPKKPKKKVKKPSILDVPMETKAVPPPPPPANLRGRTVTLNTDANRQASPEAEVPQSVTLRRLRESLLEAGLFRVEEQTFYRRTPRELMAPTPGLSIDLEAGGLILRIVETDSMIHAVIGDGVVRMLEQKWQASQHVVAASWIAGVATGFRLRGRAD